MAKRTSIFSSPVVDVSDFAPADNSTIKPQLEEIDAVSGTRFRSREAPSIPEVDNQKTKRQPMVYRTGRTVTFSVKAKQQTVDAFYAIAQARGLKAAETFEAAIAALQATEIKSL